MKRFTSLLSLFAMLTGLLVGCSGSNTVEYPTQDQHLNILFIGNSFTYYNNMPDIFQEMALSAGYDVSVTSITKGGASLSTFANSQLLKGQQVTSTLEETVFDYVVLQEHSTRPIENTESFYDGVRTLVEKIRASSPDAKILLYSTWGYADTHETMIENGWASDTMTYQLTAAYEAIAQELDCTVVYGGLTMLEIYQNTELNPFDSDEKHPSYIGSYGIAATFFYSIFGNSALEDMTYLGSETQMDAQTSGILTQIAFDVARNTDQYYGDDLRSQYGTSSEGVTAS